MIPFIFDFVNKKFEKITKKIEKPLTYDLNRSII
nr:MAG TPA: hypothetical protein [Caudoviricetes sp.]